MKKIGFATFTRLYDEAKVNSYEMFVAERGWQDWMNELEVEDITNILNEVYEIAQLTLSEVREKYGFGRAELSRLFEIPLRTLENWEKSKVVDYKTKLLMYAIVMEEGKNE